jgi:peptide/nickel transport system permease protein
MEYMDLGMKINFVFLWSDLLIFLLLFTWLLFVLWSRHVGYWQDLWHQIGSQKLAMISFVFLLTYSSVALVDSIHFRLMPQKVSSPFASFQVQSFLDLLLRPLGYQNENTYSAPFALYSSARSTALINNKVISFYPRLRYGGSHLKDTRLHVQDVLVKLAFSISAGVVLSIVLIFLFLRFLAGKHKKRLFETVKDVVLAKTPVAWREILLACTFVIIAICLIKGVSPYYHILGTNKIGEDTLFETIKSIRTGLVIGTLTTLVMLPFAIFFGIYAGYFGGWRDDLIQYVYTTLSSIPSVLLISAAVLSLQIFISNHLRLFPTLENRADARLLALCVILGITSWTSLCRLLRAETLKLREMDYVKAAIAMGVKNMKILYRHILPNVTHIVLITVVIDFSMLVLAEAVLSYVGVGVDPITPSWGNMINSARLDLAREPVVWWPLFSAFIFMFLLVLSANLFADALREALDPRLRNEPL